MSASGSSSRSTTEMARPHRNRRRQVCAGCEYDLAGLAPGDRCPECGSIERRMQDPDAIEFGHWSVWSPLAAYAGVAAIALVCVQFVGGGRTRTDWEWAIVVTGVLMAPAPIAVGCLALAPAFRSVRPAIGIVGGLLSLTCAAWLCGMSAKVVSADALWGVGALFASFYFFWIVVVLTVATACSALLLRRMC